jgi:hypothetical protein
LCRLAETGIGSGMLEQSAHPQGLDVVTACQASDVRMLRLALAGLRRHVALRRLHVITARRNFDSLRRDLGGAAELIDEDEFIPGMTLQAVRALALPGFPQGAGWYFQQLLKFQFCHTNPGDDRYLIWDADTIPLRPLDFFDEKGAMIFTIADEEHGPYFGTYRDLLGEEPRREFSFISQHMPVRKSILREMLGRIEAHLPGDGNWAWKILRHLRGAHVNLFSEYEMFGHYVKNHYPEQAVFRRLPWLRTGTLAVGGIPSADDLERLGETYAFAAFEASQRFPRRWVRRLRAWLQR